MKFAVIAHRATDTNIGLAARGWQCGPACLLSPREALLSLASGDVALNRLDVSDDLAGVEDGIWIVNQLEARGVRVFNRPSALLAAHDKLITARLLRAAGLPHPRTARLDASSSIGGLAYPIVAKPRYGSWGRCIERCDDQAALDHYVARMKHEAWWATGGIVQELVPPYPNDLRVIVSGGEVVGAAARVPALGEWRTNVALGATSASTAPPSEARELALAAVRALGIDFGGVDLLPDGDTWVVLEVNGAVDVRTHYALGREIFDAVLRSLEREATKPLLLA
jgi:RimK family alpha-L-glutamate ligase